MAGNQGIADFPKAKTIKSFPFSSVEMIFYQDKSLLGFRPENRRERESP